MPQPPQLLESTLVLTQAPLQFVWPAGQPHTPMVQLWPIGHVLPQPPQFVGLLVVSTHTPLQTC